MNKESSSISVLVVDDSTVMRRILATALEKNEDINIVGFATDGIQAIDAVRKLAPDVVTLDVEMPRMDGISALREIRKFAPDIPIIMFSTLTQVGARATVDALMSGASDYVGKPDASLGMEQAFKVLQESLVPKIRGLATRTTSRKRTGPLSRISLGEIQRSHVARSEVVATSKTIRLSSLSAGSTSAVCIGVSTGGPEALVRIFSELRPPLPFPVFIVQHMPAMFTSILAQRLSTLGKIPVVEGSQDIEVKEGTAYIAPGGRHMVVRKALSGRLLLAIEDTEPENSCKPSVDVTFRSVASVYKSGALAVVLTGMGNDGLAGAKVIKEMGGEVYVQDQESSVIWGMPGSIANAKLADKVLPLSGFAGEIIRRARLA